MKRIWPVAGISRSIPRIGWWPTNWKRSGIAPCSRSSRRRRPMTGNDNATALSVDAEARARILALATDFPRLWHDPHTPDRERKRMVRLLMEDVTLIKTADGLTTHLRFRGGATTTLTLARALNAWQLRETSAEIVALIDQLARPAHRRHHRDDAERTRLSVGHRTAVSAVAS